MKTLKTIGFLALVFAVGVAGVWLGTALRNRRVAGGGQAAMAPPHSRLLVGQAFPAVPLVDDTGRRVSTDSLDAGGAVVLFLDLECPPCADMAHKWQAAVDSGFVDPDRVWAITYRPLENIREFESTQGVSFPVLRDSLQVFRTTYAVDTFPLEVVVGASGRIRATSYDSAAPIDDSHLHDLLAR